MRISRLVSSLVLLAGCTADEYDRRAERSAERILDRRQGEVLGSREASARQPLEIAPEPEEVEPETGVAPPEVPEEELPPHVLSLRDALALAFVSNREMLTQREALHTQALSLAVVRHDFTPQLALALNYLFGENPGQRDRNTGGASFSATQILPTGATLELNAATGATAVEGNSPMYDTLVGVRLAQPLLRGGGYDVAWEPLVQAERELVYEIRAFELFREDFAIQVAQSYYDLVNQKQAIENQRINLDSNSFARSKAEALFAVGRVNELEVLRARRSELTARNGLLEAQESLELALDRFRIFLGLSDDDHVDVLPEPPAPVQVSYDVRSAIEVAFENRLDLLTRREQLEDVERGVRLSRNALLPDLDVAVGASFASLDTENLGGSDIERTDLNLAVSLEVPIDRVRERSAYRQSLIGLAQARRSLEEFEDNLRVEIHSAFRELERRLESLAIQRQLIEDQTKNLRIAELLFERGDNENRDVIEANQSLLDAQNALIDEQVSYEIARLRLMRDLGILFVDETGMWK
jgi:outer membrane protein TolC